MLNHHGLNLKASCISPACKGKTTFRPAFGAQSSEPNPAAKPIKQSIDFLDLNARNTYFSNQLRLLIQGLPVHLDQTCQGYLDARVSPPANAAVKPPLLMAVPEHDPGAYLDEASLRRFIQQVGQQATAELLPLLSLLIQTPWHPTVAWLRPALADKTAAHATINWTLPVVWVRDLQTRMLPFLKEAQSQIRQRGI